MNKILFAISFFLIFALSSCEKLADKTWTVKYQILNLDNEIPVYRMSYLLQNGSTKIVGPINTYNWNSEDLLEFKSGSIVRLEIEIISGNGNYQLQILRDEAIHIQEIMPANATIFFIEDEL